MNHAEIVGIDILWYDQLVTLPEMPAENGSAFVEGSSFQGGGKVCSALAAAGRQGIPCKLLAVCGDSRRSRFLVEDLQRHGVDTAAIRQIPGYEEGSVYDGTLIVGGGSEDGNFDFIDQLDAGEELTFTDMTGRVFRYTVHKIRHADNAKAETLADSESALTLFVKKNGAFLIVRCAAA